MKPKPISDKPNSQKFILLEFSRPAQFASLKFLILVQEMTIITTG